MNSMLRIILKRNVSAVVLFVILITFISACATRPNIRAGSLDSLSLIASENVLYLAPIIYDGLGVGNKTEQQYLEENKEGDPESIASWEKAKQEYYPSKFIDRINKTLDKVGVEVSDSDKNARYSIVIEVINLEPGWNVGIMRRPAFVKSNVSIVETANPDKVLATLGFESQGQDAMGFDFDQSYRIGEGFAKKGKDFGNILLRYAYRNR